VQIVTQFKPSRHPVFQLQGGRPAEFAKVVGHQGQTFCSGVGGNVRITSLESSKKFQEIA
jgi:hypothetical protein